MDPPTTEVTTVCIVGAGPAGMLLAYLLARQGIDVTLLEAAKDFDRDFRGDTFHSSAMDIMDQLNLTEKMAPIIHNKLSKLSLITDTETLDFVRFDWIPSKHPYVCLIPQADWLSMMAHQARQFPNFHLKMQANARGIIEEDGTVKGVHYKWKGLTRELRSTLVIGADGRGSRIRKASGLQLQRFSTPMDVLWFKLPKGEGDEAIEPLAARFSEGIMLICINRLDEWQLGWVIMKGSRKTQQQEGLQSLKKKIRQLLPALGDRVDSLKDWSQIRTLTVQLGRVKRWYRQGLLLIGDAAHIMSPVGGVGINYALMDAVASANSLIPALKTNSLTLDDLASIQKRREFPTKVIQSIQALIQQQVIKRALIPNQDFVLPLPIRIIQNIPLLRRLPAILIGRGLRSERIRHHLTTK